MAGHNSYSNLLSAEPQTPFVNAGSSGAFIEVRLVAANKMTGATYGTELLTEWKPIAKWKLSGAYSCLWLRKTRPSLRLRRQPVSPAGRSHQFHIRGQ